MPPLAQITQIVFIFLWSADMNNLQIIQWLKDTRQEYQKKQAKIDPESKWWYWWDGKLSVIDDLIQLLRNL